MRAIAVWAGILLLVGTVGLAQTISVAAGSVLVGHRLEVPIIINTSSSNGIGGYEINVQLTNAATLDIDEVRFPAAFSEAGQAQIAPDRNSVSITATDFDDQVGALQTNVTLATVVLRAMANGKSALRLNVTRLTNDNGVRINPAISEGQIIVRGGPANDQVTVVGGHDGTLVCEQVAVPVILSSAPNGLKNYKVTVTLEKPIAVIKRVEFVAFSDASQWQVSNEGTRVSFSANDAANVVGPHAVGVQLARVIFEGELPGESGLEVTVNFLNNESGTSAGTGAKDGSLKVTGIKCPPPRFFQEAPRDGLTLDVDQPNISVNIEGNPTPDSIVLSIQDSAASYVLTRRDPGVLWDGRIFSASLAQAGIRLAGGRVHLKITALNDQDKLGRSDWDLCVFSCRDAGGAQSIEAALDANANRRLDDNEIQRAIQLWIAAKVVPGTGQRIDDRKILKLIQLWISGASF